MRLTRSGSLIQIAVMQTGYGQHGSSTIDPAGTGWMQALRWSTPARVRSTSFNHAVART